MSADIMYCLNQSNVQTFQVDLNLIFKLKICHILSHTIASFGLKAGIKTELLLAACAWKHSEGFANTAICFDGSCYSTESCDHLLVARHMI